MVVEWSCEQELIVLSTIEGGSHEVHVDFLGHYCSLVVDWNAVFVDAASGVAVLADMEQFGREAVADIHHCGGYDAGFVELADYIPPGFGFELAFDQIFFAVELRNEVFVAATNVFLAFEQLQTHIGCAKVAGHAYKIGVFCSRAFHHLVLGCVANTCNGYDKSGTGCRCVASHEIHAVDLAGQTDA